MIEAVRDEVAVIRPPAWHRFPHAFSHIFAGGYASGYYSYLWAEVLAADGFDCFAEAGLVDRTVGDGFRDEVLSPRRNAASGGEFSRVPRPRSRSHRDARPPRPALTGGDGRRIGAERVPIRQAA